MHFVRSNIICKNLFFPSLCQWFISHGCKLKKYFFYEETKVNETTSSSFSFKGRQWTLSQLVCLSLKIFCHVVMRMKWFTLFPGGQTINRYSSRQGRFRVSYKINSNPIKKDLEYTNIFESDLVWRMPLMIVKG